MSTTTNNTIDAAEADKYYDATVSCAAGNNCKFKGVRLRKDGHDCMNCGKPMHGAPCGALWSERGDDCRVDPKLLSTAGQSKVNSDTAVICGTCIDACTPSNNTQQGGEKSNEVIDLVDTNDNNNKKRTASTLNLKPAAPSSKKPKDSLLYDQVTIEHNEDGTLDACCNNCNGFVKKRIKTFNATKFRTHCLSACIGIDKDVKQRLAQTSQAAKKQNKSLMLASSSQTMSELRESMPSTLAASANSITQSSTKKKFKPQSKINGNDGGFGEGINRAEAAKIITGEVKAILSRREPLSRLFDPYVRASLNQRYPGIDKHIPADEDTIFNNYVIPIDNEAREELEKFIMKLPGLTSISMDGATILGKQKVSTLLQLLIYITLYYIAANQLYFNQTHTNTDSLHNIQVRFLHVP